MEDLRARRARPGGRRPRRRVSPRWVGRTGCVLAAALLFSAYGSGVTYGHWAVQAFAETAVGTGDLDLEVGDPPGFSLECTSRVFPKHAISFVRFWDPALPPGPLSPAKAGAVKIEGSGIHLGGGSYWVEPPDAGLGDPMTIHLGAATVRITAWVAKPGSPGQYVGFYYEVEGGPVVVDVKTGGNLDRWVISGSGLWPPEGYFLLGDGVPRTRQGVALFLCSGAAVGYLTLANAGTIPAAAHLEWAYGPGADPASCAYFDARIRDAGSLSVLFDGSLCDLVGQTVTVSPQIDPGGSATLEIVMSLHPGASPGGDLSLPMVSRVTFWQWTGGPPDSPGAYGWWELVEAPFQISLILVAPAGPAMWVEAAPAPTEAAAVPEAATTPAPGAGTTSIPADELDTTDTGTTAPPPESTTTTPAPPGEPLPMALAGRVWEDLDGDGLTAAGHLAQEPAAAGVEVRLLAEDGTFLAATGTTSDGTYRFEGLGPGSFRVEFRAPEGFTFRAPAPAPADPVDLAASLGIGPERVVVDDVAQAETPAEGETARAQTAAFSLEAAPTGEGAGADGPADAALTRVPQPSAGSLDGEAAAPAGGAGPGEEGSEEDVPAALTDPNTQASPSEEPQLEQVTVGGGQGAGGGGEAGGGQVAPPADPPGPAPAPPAGGEVLP